MTAESVAVGTELLLGDIVDTNSAELGKVLAEFGVVHLCRQTVGDNVERLTAALSLALSRSDIVFTIGGLGPTMDDVTRDGIAAALGDQLVHDVDIEKEIRNKLESRGIPVVPNQSRQASRPSCARPLPNINGTAPGLICQKDGKTVVALPGPKLEFVPMLHGPVSDYLRTVSDGVIHSRTLKIAGMGESMVEERLEDLMQGENPTVAPYAKTGEVHLRVTAKADTREKAEASVGPVVAEIESRLGDLVYGFDGESLESSILTALEDRIETLAVAESCTGGGLGKIITSVPGSSKVFLGGVLSYTNELKQALLGVSPQTLKDHGEVSEQCAKEMAEGVVNKTGATWGVSITGIAGPGGGSKTKPVGLVYIAVAGPGGTTFERNQFPGDREGVRARSERAALLALRKRIISAAQ
ncbi:MAG TPA: competence/damage-inducible protein A [Fimbriimonadaceae bacterium]|nr:competence/damage-inducible protein A [Fimbriimonadaceae bacterium]